MATKKNLVAKKTVRAKPKTVEAPKPTGLRRVTTGLKSRTSAYLARRPHRSFRLTRRRDYRRALQLPGFWSLTKQVTTTLLSRKWTFLLLALIYIVLTVVLIGIASQTTFTGLANSLKQTSSDLFSGGLGQLGQASLLFLAAVGGSLSPQSTDQSTSIYTIIIAMLVWLTVVWLMRQQLAGNRVRLRDGLYSAGAPILATFVLVLVMVVQLLPVGLAALGYAAASASGLLNGGVEAMLFWFGAGLLTLLSLYWLTSTFFALVIVTIPGMYPFVALKRAGDLVVGRRVRILVRILWAALLIAIAWVVVFIPLILLDTWLNGVWPWFAGVPVVPIALLIMSAVTLIWFSAYVYVLYRKVVDDGSEPA